jgi:hypothetical protein
VRRKYWLCDPPATLIKRRCPIQTLTGRYFRQLEISLQGDFFVGDTYSGMDLEVFEVRSRVEDSVGPQWFETLEREAQMADARSKFTPLFAPRKTGLDWIDNHRQQVRLWFAGLPDEDQREILELVEAHPLLTYQALREIAESRKPR